MAHIQSHSVQPFIRGKRGAIGAGPLMQCSTAAAAKRLAERLVAENRAVGALAFSCQGAVSADEYAEPTFLARIGEVPESDDY